MTKEIVIKGQWFLPADKDKRLYGTLIYNPLEGITLELHGSFGKHDYIPEIITPGILLGVSNTSEEITLVDCREITATPATFVSGSEMGFATIVYSAKYLLVGTHADSETDLVFNKAVSEIFNLNEWLAITGFKKSDPTREQAEKFQLNIEYVLPEPIEFEIDATTKGVFNFVIKPPPREILTTKVSIEQRSQFHILSQNEMKIDDLLEYLFTFQNFLVLALYRGTFPTSITLTGPKHLKESLEDEPQRNKAVKLCFWMSNFKPSPTPLLLPELIFSYKSIEANFPNIIKEWYKKYEVLEPAFDLVFEQFYRGNFFNTNTFLNLAQAAETFHAKLYNHKKMPEADYDKMKKEIYAVAPPEYHEWLKGAFSFGNHLNLHTRLEEIIDKYCNSFIDSVLPDKQKFLMEIKQSRNYYTHYTDKAKHVKEKSALFYLAEKVKLLLVCAFLMELGFSKEDIGRSLENLKFKLFYGIMTWKEPDTAPKS